MSKSKLPTAYLAGGMEAEKALGAGWREVITPKLDAMGYEVLNPCLFESQQLKGLHTNRLPDTITTASGNVVSPKHWHELKHATRDSDEYKRFKRYMQRIVRYDLNIVRNETDVVICNWTKGTAKGAGTHSELTVAFESGLPVLAVVQTGVDMPAWSQACCTSIFTTFEDLLVELDKTG